MTAIRGFLILLAFLLIPNMATADIWRINPEGTGDAPTIQAAVDSAETGDTILLSPGIYTGSGNRDIDLRGKDLLLRSQAGPEGTILECQGTQEEPHCGFIFDHGETPALMIMGVTIQGGHGRYDLSLDRSVGGGAFCRSASPTFVDCIFLNNYADYGGGMYCHYSEPRFLECIFRGNQATYPAGGLYCFNSSVTITDCLFSENLAGTSGAGIYCYESSPSISYTIFYGNEADITGGGLGCSRNCDPVFTSCTFHGNGALSGGSAISCLVSSTALISHSIITAGLGGGPIHCNEGGTPPSLECCDIYGNAGGDWIGCIAGQQGSYGNFAADPRLCDPAGGNFGLAADSPCLRPLSCGLVGALGEACGSSSAVMTEGRVTTSTWGLVKHLLDPTGKD